MQTMSHGRGYLLSGCSIEKIAEPLVEWNARAADVYDMGYSHA